MVALSTGTSFASGSVWFQYCPYGHFLADVNGDHKADVVTFDPGGPPFWMAPAVVRIGFSTGSSFEWTSTFSVPPVGDPYGYFADINGDGKTDMLSLSPGYREFLSNGVSFSAGPRTFGDPGYAYYDFADFNGDGAADLLGIDPGGNIFVHLTTAWKTPAQGCTTAQQCTTGACINGGCCDPTNNTDPLASIAINPTAPTDFVTQVAPLYTGSAPVQALGTSGAIDPKRVSVIRGKVLNASGTAGIPCARVTVVGSPNVGATATRADGSYTIAVNGGAPVTIRVESNGYLSSDRQVDTRWLTYSAAKDVRLLQPGTPQLVATDSQGAVTSSTVVSGDTETDAQGTRVAKLLFPAETKAIVAGEPTARPNFKVQIKEMTNTSTTGRDGMVASLPNATAFTYAVSLSLEGAENKSVTFSQSIPVYIDNFLGMPNGELVPVGYYDTGKAQWVASDNGRVINILGKNNATGEALLDIDANSGAESASIVNTQLGITHDELVQLATAYSAGAPGFTGKSLWRFATTHFSAWDANWGWGPPGPMPKNPTPSPPPPPCGGSTAVGSLIDCESQALREHFAIAGTPFSLYYSSARQPGGERPLRIPLTADALPPDLQSVKLEINVAGRLVTQEFSSPVANQSYDFRWDGRDASGRALVGAQPITTRVGFHYNGTYRRTASFGANGQSVAVAAGNNRFDATIWQTWTGFIERWNAQQVGLGGWDFDVHHGYDPVSGSLHRGDGRDEIVPTSLTVFKKLPLTPRPIPPNNALAVGPDGSVYFVETGSGNNSKIKRLAPDNTVTQIAGTDSRTELPYPYGDGGPASSATLFSPNCLAVGPNQKLYVCEGQPYQGYGRVRVIDLAGNPPTISAFAGGGTAPTPPVGTSVVPTSVHLLQPTVVSVMDDGTVLIGDNGLSIHRVRDQRLSVFAPVSTNAMAVGKDGSVYASILGNDNMVLKIDPTGATTELTHSNYHGVCDSRDPPVSA